MATIPYIADPQGHTVESTLELTRAEDAGGVLVKSNDSYKLVFRAHLLAAQDQNVEWLSDVNEGQHVALLPDDFTSWQTGQDAQVAEAFEFSYENDGAGSPQGRSASSNGEQTLPSAYTLAELKHAHATLITQRETFAHMLATSLTYKCEGSPTHYFPNGDIEATLGEVCPLFPQCRPNTRIVLA